MWSKDGNQKLAGTGRHYFVEKVLEVGSIGKIEDDGDPVLGKVVRNVKKSNVGLQALF